MLIYCNVRYAAAGAPQGLKAAPDHAVGGEGATYGPVPDVGPEPSRLQIMIVQIVIIIDILTSTVVIVMIVVIIASWSSSAGGSRSFFCRRAAGMWV